MLPSPPSCLHGADTAQYELLIRLIGRRSKKIPSGSSASATSPLFIPTFIATSALKRTGKLSHLAGLIIGGITEMKDNKVRFNKSAEEIISETVAEYGYPVLYGFPSGHIRENNPLIFGRSIKLKIEVDSEIAF